MTYNKKKANFISFIFYAAFLILIINILIYIICFIQSILFTDSIKLLNTNFSYKFNMIIGYVEINFKNLPPNSIINNEYVFIRSVIIGNLVTSSLPLFIILIYGQKMLNVITNENSPFVLNMPIYIKNIGIILIIMGFVEKLINQLIINYASFHKLYFNNPIEFKWIISGLLFILLSEIFQKGVYLQKMDDETL